MLHRLHRFLYYASASPEEFRNILPEIHESNRKRLLAFSGVTVTFLLVMVLITSIDRSLGIRFWIYLLPLLAVTAILLVTLGPAQHHPALLRVCIYCFISVLYLFAIYVSTTSFPTQTAGTFLAFLLAIPLLFVLRPVENVILVCVYDGLFILAAALVKDSSIVPIDVVNALVFGGIGIIVSCFMLNTTIENFVIKNSLDHLANFDQLTQLQNCTCYERRLAAYPAACGRSLTCVYADANGLHALNDTQGHAAGDEMLKTVGAALQAQFGTDHTYRIGGDEFVAFAPDLEAPDLTEKLAAFSQAVQAAHYHTAVGHASCAVEGLDMDALIKTAEQQMYAAKEQFYAAAPHTRRRY